MNHNTLMAIVCVSGVLIVGMVAATDSLTKMEKENNAFAKECNDRGGMVIVDINMKQCIGAKRVSNFETSSAPKGAGT